MDPDIRTPIYIHWKRKVRRRYNPAHLHNSTLFLFNLQLYFFAWLRKTATTVSHRVEAAVRNLTHRNSIMTNKIRERHMHVVLQADYEGINLIL